MNCKYCNKECKSINGLHRHENVCHSNPNRRIPIVNNKNNMPSILFCKYCGKECHNMNSLMNHERLCPENPNKNKSNLTGHKTSWNKGLRKDNDNRIENYSNKSSITLTGRIGREDTEEEKRKISLKMIGNKNNNPNKTGRGIKGWYKGFYCSSTYELAYVIYCLDHNIDIKRCHNHYQYDYLGKKHRYYPDFVVDGTIIEIKGFWTPQVEAKTLAVTDMPIKVLYYNDLIFVFDYIKEAYGKIVDKDISDLYEM